MSRKSAHRAPRAAAFSVAALSAVLLGFAGIAAALPSASASGNSPLPDASRTGSLTITKHFNPAASTQDDGTEKTVTGAGSAIEGVTFSIAQVVSYEGNPIVLTSIAGWETAAKLSADIAATAPAADGTATRINLPASDLGRLLYVCGPTLSDGSCKVTGLPLGLYLVSESSLPAGVAPADDFLITLPMTNPKGNGWLYDVFVYPKNNVAKEPSPSPSPSHPKKPKPTVTPTHSSTPTPPAKSPTPSVVPKVPSNPPTSPTVAPPSSPTASPTGSPTVVPTHPASSASPAHTNYPSPPAYSPTAPSHAARIAPPASPKVTPGETVTSPKPSQSASPSSSPTASHSGTARPTPALAVDVTRVTPPAGDQWAGIHQVYRLEVFGNPGDVISIHVNLPGTGLANCLVVSSYTEIIGEDGTADFFIGFIYADDIGPVKATVDIKNETTGATDTETMTFQPADYLDTSGIAAAKGCTTGVNPSTSPAPGSSPTPGAQAGRGPVGRALERTGVKYTAYGAGGLLLIAAGAVALRAARRKIGS